MPKSTEVNSIIKATEIMKCLSNGIYKLSDIAKKLQYNKATVHRILKTLEKVDFVIQDQHNSRYYPGALLYTLADQSLKAHELLSQCAIRHMETLRDTIEESVFVQIPLGSKRITVESVLFYRPIMHYSKPGDANPIYTGAAGKILLSKIPEDTLSGLLQNTELVPQTNKTITDKTKLLEQIKQIRIQNHCIEFGEYTEGAGAIAVPIEGYVCPAALSVAGMEGRLKANARELLIQIEKTAEKISKQIAAVYGNERCA